MGGLKEGRVDKRPRGGVGGRTEGKADLALENQAIARRRERLNAATLHGPTSCNAQCRSAPAWLGSTHLSI